LRLRHTDIQDVIMADGPAGPMSLVVPRVAHMKRIWDAHVVNMLNMKIQNIECR